MKLDTTRVLTDWRGTPIKHGPEDAGMNGQPWRLGEWLARHLGSSPAVPKEKVTRAAVLCIRLETAPELALAADDVALIRQVVENTPGMPPWCVGAVRYFLDPDGLSDDERATFAAAYDAPANGVDLKQMAAEMLAAKKKDFEEVVDAGIRRS